MKQTVRILILMAIMAAAAIGASAQDFRNETLHYKVMYKWGLINKQAGTVAVNLRVTPTEYLGKLTARTDPWADPIYKLRDTLNCRISRDGFVPRFYEKIAHEGSDDKHDVVEFVYNGNSVTGECTRVEYKKGKLKKDERRTLQAFGTTVDMYSAFYYMRKLHYEDWAPGTQETLTIFSGRHKEVLKIKYIGREKIKVDNKEYDCNHISFLFTSDDGKKTSDDMDAWITVGADRLPVQLEGKLAVGKVRGQLTSITYP